MERQVSRNRESQPVPLACDTESALCQDLQGIHTDTEVWDITVKAKNMNCQCGQQFVDISLIQNPLAKIKPQSHTYNELILAIF